LAPLRDILIVTIRYRILVTLGKRCHPAQAVDQQPLKTAQFYAISRKSEGVPDIQQVLPAFRHPDLSGKRLSIFITGVSSFRS
jgi:hypothetical protein